MDAAEWRAARGIPLRSNRRSDFIGRCRSRRLIRTPGRQLAARHASEWTAAAIRLNDQRGEHYVVHRFHLHSQREKKLLRLLHVAVDRRDPVFADPVTPRQGKRAVCRAPSLPDAAPGHR